jgi:hypothetical protein
MADDQPPASAATPADDKGRRKPPTIDLKATEIEGGAADPAGQAAAAGKQLEGGSSQEPQQKDVLSGRVQRPPRGPGTWTALATGAVGGAVISLLFLAADIFLPRDGGVRGFVARLAHVEGALREAPSQAPAHSLQGGAIDALAGRLGKLESAVATSRPAPEAGAANRLAAIEGELKALGESVGGLGRRSDEVTSAAREARQRADDTAAALAELARRAPPGPADVTARARIEGELQTLTTRLATVEGGQKANEAEVAKHAAVQGRDRSGRMAVAAAALNAALERGEPFAAELAAVKSLAADPKLLTPLEPFATSGVPTPAALARELTALMPALRAASVPPPPRNGGFLDKLQSNAEKLVRIRPLDEAPGTDPAAILARIGVKTARGDVAGALADLAELPPAGRAPAGAWIEKAQARSAAVESSRRLAADALAGLSK